MYVNASPDVVRRVAGINLKEREAWTDEIKWQTCIKHKWKLKGIINVLEFEALIRAVRWFTRNTENLQKRILIMSDSAAVISAVTKGQSSNSRFNRLCQRVASIALAGDAEVVL